MTTLTDWLSANTMHSLGWTLLHFLWQGTAIAALTAVFMSLSRRASTRYALAVFALVLMLVAPVATFIFLTPASAPVVLQNLQVAPTAPTFSRGIARVSSGFSRLSQSPDVLPWLVEAWLIGVAFFSLRCAGGFLLVERERRKRSKSPSVLVLDVCQTLQRRLGLKRTIRYCECKWLQAPAVIGWFRPIVLLPVASLTGLSEEQLQSIIVHELAHIQRLDPFVNVFQICVETLLFYHPAIWWLNKRIRAEREHCCDDVAISLCGNPVEYARALTLMEEWRSAPVLGMAANRGPLAERIFRVLGLKPIAYGTRGIGLTGGLLCLTAALVAGNALFGIAYPKPIVHASESLASVTRMHFAQAGAASPQSPSSPAAAATPATSGSYIDGMKAAGLGDLTVDELVSMKIQGVTPEYVRGVREQGLHPDAENIVALRIQGVTPEYIHELRGLGLSPDEDQIVSMRIQGVTAEYVRGLKENGVSEADIDQLISLRIQGVTPAYVRGLREQGLQPNVDNLLGMRIQGVTPEYVRDIHALGLKPTVDDFISMRIQGVTQEYVKGLQSAGFKFDIDELVNAKIQGITPEFVERARKHGFKDLDLDKLIHLKQMDILETPADL